MPTLRSRLNRLEQTRPPAVVGRFITVRAGKCTDAQARQYLTDLGVALGPRDLLLLETHSDSGAGRSVRLNEPFSHEIIDSPSGSKTCSLG